MTAIPGILLVVFEGATLSLIWRDYDVTDEVYKRRRYWTVWAKKGIKCSIKIMLKALL